MVIYESSFSGFIIFILAGLLKWYLLYRSFTSALKCYIVHYLSKIPLRIGLKRTKDLLSGSLYEFNTNLTISYLMLPYEVRQSLYFAKHMTDNRITPISRISFFRLSLLAKSLFSLSRSTETQCSVANVNNFLVLPIELIYYMDSYFQSFIHGYALRNPQGVKNIVEALKMPQLAPKC